MLWGRAGRQPSPGSDWEPDEVIEQTSSNWGTKGRGLLEDSQTCTPAGVTRCVAKAQGQKLGPEAELLITSECEGFQWTRIHGLYHSE